MLQLELVRNPARLAEQARQVGLAPPTTADLVTEAPPGAHR
jgi:hypothetical protein